MKELSWQIQASHNMSSENKYDRPTESLKFLTVAVSQRNCSITQVDMVK